MISTWHSFRFLLRSGLLFLPVLLALLPPGLLLLLPNLQLPHSAIVGPELAPLLTIWCHALQTHKLIQLFVIEPQDLVSGQPIVLLCNSTVVKACFQTANVVLIIQLVILS